MARGRHPRGRDAHRQRRQGRPGRVADRHRDGVEADRGVLVVLRIALGPHPGEDLVELREAVEAAPGRRDERAAAVLAGDVLGGSRGEDHAAARRGEGRGPAADVGDEPHRVGRLLDRDVHRVVAVERGEADRLVVLREEIGGDAAERDDDRELGGARADRERLDAELVEARLVPDDPRALHEHRADAVQRALGEAELAGELGERERPARDEQLQHPERGMDSRRARRARGCRGDDDVAHRPSLYNGRER